MVISKKQIEKIKVESEELGHEIREKLVGYILAGFGLIASLAWNDAIKALIEHLFPLQQNTVLAKFVYALFMTLVLVLLSVYLVRIFKREKKTDTKI